MKTTTMHTFTTSNPLLNFDGLSHFDAIQAEHITPAVDAILSTANQVIAQLEKLEQAPTWNNFAAPLEAITEKVKRVWGVVSHLHSVVDTPLLREAYNANQDKITEFWTRLSQNQNLFKGYQALATKQEQLGLDDAQKKIVSNTVRDFRLGGAELVAEKKQSFAKLLEESAQLSSRFSENVLDATNEFTLLIENEGELSGLPLDNIKAAKFAAEQAGKKGYQFTLHFPSYFPLMQYADSRALREKMYRAYVTRASELSDQGRFDNTKNMQQLLRLRCEQAQLLGFTSYADLSIETKMAQNPQEVLDFLHDLAKRGRPFAEKDYQELKDFAKNELQLATLEAWDMSYVSEKLRQKKFSFSDLEVKQYFPENKVITGLFHIAATLFGLRILADQAPTWHPDVRFYRIEQIDEKGEYRLLGQFYLDLYARPGKRSGAWMDDARSRQVNDGYVQTPVAYLVCNFTPPLPANAGEAIKPVLLTHDEVITLFHEFGHGLHHLLTEVNESGVAGIAGVEWDGVELPSQFMENFCWEWEVLQTMTAYQGDDVLIIQNSPLPKVLFEKMLAAKNFHVGLQMLRQVEFALFDLHLHYDFDVSGGDIQQQLAAIRKQVAVIIPPEFNRFAHSFSHIFAGGYAAGYYSYHWAEVLSADAFAAFEEAAAVVEDSSQKSILDIKTGYLFRKEILSKGGIRPFIESFEAFRGRKPKIDALLRHQGMMI